jgi:hypothetical protein
VLFSEAVQPARSRSDISEYSLMPKIGKGHGWVSVDCRYLKKSNQNAVMLKQIGLLLAISGLLTTAHAQKSLAEVATEAGVDWLLGQWQSDSNGDVLALSFKAELDKHVIIVNYKDRRSETMGMILLEPGTMEPKYYAGDNLGGAGTGEWSAEDNKAILKHKHTDIDGKITKLGFTFTKVNADSMEVKIFALNDQNEMGSEARSNTTFQRKK